ncbi:hypothetical protein [Pseudomonas izuensis]|uniref:hypothetical protein n=1 Tax=Pseudomonas izuensis TaxID=2684212 RepID=UPI00135920C0|nr:hypothetical protein [Pseudomonas izuensis]
MKFSNLLHPIFDETFPSWLTRCALNPKISGISERDIIEWKYEDDQKRRFLAPGLSMEFDFHESRGLALARELHLDVCIIEKIFRPTSTLLLSPNYRTAYCHLCIQSDVLQKRFPSWRKSWCYVTQPYCPIHWCLLSFIDGYPILDKQWNAYVRGNLGDYYQGRKGSSYTRRHMHGLPPNNIRAWLTLRVQMWINKIDRTRFCVLPGTDVLVDSIQLTSAVNFILRLFLVPRTDRNSSGVAKELLTAANPLIVHKVLDFKDRLDYGASNSVPYERMCALLLLGKIFNIFSPKEHSMFKKIVLDSEFDFPDSKTLGELSAGHVHAVEYSTLERQLGSLDVVSDYLSDFIEGVLC